MSLLDARQETGQAGMLVSVLVLLVGAGVYALVEGPLGATFYLTPAFVGVTAIAAGLAGSVRSLVGSGLALLGWGGAVLLVHYGTVPAARTAPADLVGVVVGILAARALAPADQRVEWLTAGALAAGLGGLGYFLAFGLPWVGRWPAWSITVVVWAAYVAVTSVLRRPRRQVAPAG